jgi:NhaP-type Na+/H+ or K+/H+ antiporter
MLLTVFIVLLFLYSLASHRLERTIVTAPVLFTAAGGAVWLLMPDQLGARATPSVFLHLAEIGLVLLLFTDASKTDLSVLGSIRALPTRLLSVGMLLTILLGALAALLVLPGLSIWEAAILAAILAPTDAGLGQVIVNSPRVPMSIRQALNVEAGLNDGLSVPFLLFFIALAVSGGGDGEASLMEFVVEQLGYGALIGGAIGLAGGAALGWAVRRRWMAESHERLGAVALPLLCLLASEHVGASMFIAAFVAGLAVQIGFPQAGRRSVEFTQEWGELVNLSVFFLFGMVVARSWPELGLPAAVYALLSLTAVRMLPVAIALVGSRLSAASVLFMGWFGPRGLASIVLGLVYLEEEARLPGEPVIRVAVIATVALSVFAHGFTAMPGIRLYERELAALPADAPELRPDVA